MKWNDQDKTIERNYLKKWRFLINEYEDIKQHRHSRFRFASDFFKFHGTHRQTFLKYYHRFKGCNGLDSSLLPQKRGPRWHTGKPLGFIENKVLELRRLGLNRYEIHQILKERLKQFTPSSSGIYNICKRHGLNRLTKKMKQTQRKIIKERAGELGHIDCHYLSTDLLKDSTKRYYLVAVVDDCTRLAWCEVVEDITSLTTMFSVLRSFNMLQNRYKIQFEEVMTDNGPEFGGGTNMQNEQTNPFRRMLLELGVKHRYTKPYRPQTNGKVERFWRTLENDMIEDADYDNIEEFKNELLHYLVYYNEHRPHQGLDGKIPVEYLKNLSSN